MALSTAVVASRSSLLGAVTSLMRSLAAVEASAASGLVVHYDMCEKKEEKGVLEKKRFMG